MPYERFVIFLKSRSHYTHLIHHFILFHKKCFSPTLGGNTKNIPFMFSSNKAPIPLYYLSNILYERSIWLCKRKNRKKIDKCPKYQNNGYFDARLEKREKEERKE
jgi:hypothetical protein